MNNAHGTVFKYGDNVDTDVIIPARYLNSFDAKEDMLINEKNKFVRRKNLSVNFSPIVKIIKIESFKNI